MNINSIMKKLEDDLFSADKKLRYDESKIIKNAVIDVIGKSIEFTI